LKKLSLRSEFVNYEVSLNEDDERMKKILKSFRFKISRNFNQSESKGLLIFFTETGFMSKKNFYLLSGN